VTESYHLIVFLEDRTQLGALRNALTKYAVQFVYGSEEQAVADRYVDRDGLLLTFIDWRPAAVIAPKGGGAERLELSEDLSDMIEEIASAAHDKLEVGIYAPGGTFRQRARVDLHRLRDELAVGCRYQVNP